MNSGHASAQRLPVLQRFRQGRDDVVARSISSPSQRHHITVYPAHQEAVTRDQSSSRPTRRVVVAHRARCRGSRTRTGRAVALLRSAGLNMSIAPQLNPPVLRGARSRSQINVCPLRGSIASAPYLQALYAPSHQIQRAREASSSLSLGVLFALHLRRRSRSGSCLMYASEE